MARLRRRRDDLGVIAVREHRSSPPWPRLSFADGCIEVLGRRDLEALHADSERALVIGLDQQMDVIVLDAQLHDAEVLAARRRQRGLSNRLVGTAATKLPDRRDHAQRDVHGIPGVQERALLVRRARPLALRRTTGAAALTAARREQLLLHGLPAKHAM